MKSPLAKASLLVSLALLSQGSARSEIENESAITPEILLAPVGDIYPDAYTADPLESSASEPYTAVEINADGVVPSIGATIIMAEIETETIPQNGENENASEPSVSEATIDTYNPPGIYDDRDNMGLFYANGVVLTEVFMGGSDARLDASEDDYNSSERHPVIGYGRTGLSDTGRGNAVLWQDLELPGQEGLALLACHRTAEDEDVCRDIDKFSVGDAGFFEYRTPYVDGEGEDTFVQEILTLKVAETGVVNFEQFHDFYYAKKGALAGRYVMAYACDYSKDSSGDYRIYVLFEATDIQINNGT